MTKNIIPIFLLLTLNVPYVHAQEEGLRDVRGPVGYPADSTFGVLMTLVVLVVLGIGLYFFIQYRKKKSAPIEVAPKPWEIALAKIQMLRKSKQEKPGDLEVFYSELSDVLREYIENQFAIPAVEMTTEEFLASLKDNQNLSGDHKKLLKQFLHNADMVKFAKFKPSHKDTEEGYEVAKKFISQTQGGA